MTNWAEKERRHFLRTFMDSQKLFKGSFRVNLNNKKMIRETYVTKRAVAKKNGRSCRVWIFCVSCVHEDALCTLMIYHGGLMCHQLYHGTFLAENESKRALIFIQMCTLCALKVWTFFSLCALICTQSWTRTSHGYQLSNLSSTRTKNCTQIYFQIIFIITAKTWIFFFCYLIFKSFPNFGP